MTRGTQQTAAAVLDTAVRLLADAGVSEAPLKAETLLARTLGCKRLELTMERARALDAGQLAAYREGIARLLDGEPIQYVLGDASFMGRDFAVDPRVLIPRPETEELVESVLACEGLWRGAAPAIADVCTGSGCIAVSLALARTRGRYVATDTSEDALRVARENARRLGAEGLVRFARADLLEGVGPGTLDAVVSNPPYVSAADWLQLPREIRDYEPRAALDGGEDGLALISRLVSEAAAALKSGGWVFIEIGEDQASRVAAGLTRAGFAHVTIRKDVAGRDRMALGRKE